MQFTIISGLLKNQRSFPSFVIVCGLGMLLGVAAVKNISYPLLWNDEAETIMTAQQITKYGYPKVHDGRNVVFMPDNTIWLGYKPSADANITMPWGCYYYAVTGVWLARFTDDIYLKTAVVRLPFAIAGLLGLAVFVFAYRRFFADKVRFRVFLASFILLEMLSVNMLLHIREARYYPIVILLTACYFYVTAMFYFHNKYSRFRYILLLTSVLTVTFNVNTIAFAAMYATTALFLCFQYFNRHSQKSGGVDKYNLSGTLVLAIPLLLSIILIFPEVIFFETFRTARLANIYYNNSIYVFARHVHAIVTILSFFELLPAMLIITIIRLAYQYSVKSNSLIISNTVCQLKGISFFMLLFFIVYILITARMPFLFTRYFIVLQPVLVLILLSNVAILQAYVRASSVVKTTIGRWGIAAMSGGICLINVVISGNHISDYAYQLLHPYQGPLDYIIPEIRQMSVHPEKLVIATNYEEMSYEYYLNCKVILGYKNHFQLPADTSWKQEVPDFIIQRPGWPQDDGPCQYYLQHARYKKISFPVQNSPANNVPEMYGYLKHFFKTRFAETEHDRVYMYVKI